METSNVSRNVCKSLRSAGISPKDTYAIIDQVKVWVEKSGVEWTIQRLKSIKEMYISILAHDPKRAEMNSQWIKCHRTRWNGVNWKVPNGAIQKLFYFPKGKSGKERKRIQQCLSGLMMYSSFKSKSITDKQRTKFYSAVENDRKVDWKKGTIKKWIASTPRWPLPHLSYQRGNFAKVVNYINKDVRAPFEFEDKNGDIQLRTKKVSFETILSTAGCDLALDWMNSSTFAIPDDIYKVISKSAIEGDGQTDYVGVISHIQEPGFKLRSIANPLPIFQIALSRMGAVLYDWLKNNPNDYTHDQEGGVKELERLMKSGKDIISIDISNATDSMPLDFIIDCLESSPDKVFTPEDLELFKKIARGKFRDPVNPKGYTQWTVGQPLGVYPSFGGFAFSHHTLVGMCSSTIEREDVSYGICGDDLFIERDVGQVLLKAYKALGMKVSPSKTIDTGIINEFCSRIVSKDYGQFYQPKWSDISDMSFIALCRSIGPQMQGLLKPRQKKVIKAFAEVPKELHPYGMGWNPHGKTYAQREKESQALISQVTQKFDTYHSANRRSLDDLKFEMLYRNGGEFKLEYENNCYNPPTADFETKVLDHIGISSVKTDRDFWHGWTKSFDLVSDPRGISTLLLAEKQIKDARSIPKYTIEQNDDQTPIMGL